MKRKCSFCAVKVRPCSRTCTRCRLRSKVGLVQTMASGKRRRSQLNSWIVVELTSCCPIITLNERSNTLCTDRYDRIVAVGLVITDFDFLSQHLSPDPYKPSRHFQNNLTVHAPCLRRLTDTCFFMGNPSINDWGDACFNDLRMSIPNKSLGSPMLGSRRSDYDQKQILPFRWKFPAHLQSHQRRQSVLPLVATIAIAPTPTVSVMALSNIRICHLLPVNPVSTNLSAY